MQASAEDRAPVLRGSTIRLEPIDRELARLMLAGTPGPLPWEEGFPMAPVLEIVRAIAAASEAPGPYTAYVIVRERDGLAVGDAGFHGPPDAAGEVEIGYAVVPLARRAGVAREAAGLLARWALSQLGVTAVVARVREGNAASAALLTQIGFVADGERDGHLRFVLRPR
jgi:RimJ/RimL family protein N-acetyltransferase